MVLVGNHLKRRREFTPTSTNIQTCYNVESFFDFLRIGNEPLELWGVGSLLIFFGHRRNIPLEQYDLRVEKQNFYNWKRSQAGCKIAHLNSYVASPRGFLGADCLKYLEDSDFKK